MLFSIIIPVYNVEPYLPQCIDTLLPVVEGDCELILVLGESTDKSSEIAMEYAKQNERICAIVQSGKGLSNARNCGVQIAAGQFILYIDSDDFVNTENLCVLMQHIRENSNEADVYMTDFHRLYASGRVERIQQIGDQPYPLYGMNNLPDVLSKKKCFWNVWRFVYRKNFLEKYQITFLENKNSEDMDYTTQVLMYQPRIIFWNKPFYFYRVGWGNSLMDVVSLKRVQDVTFVIENCIKRLDQQILHPYQSLLQEQYRFEYLLNISLICEVRQPDKQTACCAFKNWRRVLRPAHTKEVKLFYCFMSICGLRAGSFILLVLKKIKRMLTRK